jgi:hypothetical protein
MTYDDSPRTYLFRPIRSLDTRLPVEGRPSETFGALAARFYSTYRVPSHCNFCIGQEIPYDSTPLSALPDGEFTVWGEGDSLPPSVPFDGVEAPPRAPNPGDGFPILALEEEEEEEVPSALPPELLAQAVRAGIRGAHDD